MRHVISTSDFSREYVESLICSAEAMRGTERPVLRQRLQGMVIATLFYEPSTRTRFSFETAAVRLGASVVGAENALESSSAKKGESLEDVFRIVGGYADAIVIRHHETDSISEAVHQSPVPVINAGAGSGEHPTQALLDVYTLWREFGRIDGLNVCMIGDLKYGRTIHSLLKILRYFDDIQVTLVHPQGLGIPKGFIDDLKRTGLRIHSDVPMNAALAEADVIYQTRVQKERLASAEEAEQASAYGLRMQHLELMKPEARIMHPLPRVDEIDPGIDADPRAAYFRQAKNGLYMRMSLIDDILRDHPGIG